MRAAAILLVVCAVAHAEEPPTAPALFKRGVEALRAKDFAAASTAFQQSYALSPKPATVCNLALTYDRWGGHVAEAVEAYRKCAEDDDSGRFRDHALERARQLRAELAATTTPPSPPPTSEPSAPDVKPEPPVEPPPAMAAPITAPATTSPPPSIATPPATVAPAQADRATRPFFKDRAACVLSALGVAGVGAGVGLIVAAKLDDGHIATTVDLGQKATLYSRAGTLQLAGYITLGVGAALVVAGIVEWAAHGRHVAARARATRAGWSF